MGNSIPSPLTKINKKFLKIINLLFIFVDIYNKTNQGGDYMLVLGMRPNDYILIGDDIMVKVIKSSGDNIRLAIDAPKDVPVVRGDVYERNICKENIEKDKID